MFIRSQAYGKGRIVVVDTNHVASWEVSDVGTLYACVQSGECIRMGRFANQEEALKWLGRVPIKIAGGAFAMQVPDLEEEREE